MIETPPTNGPISRLKIIEPPKNKAPLKIPWTSHLTTFSRRRCSIDTSNRPSRIRINISKISRGSIFSTRSQSRYVCLASWSNFSGEYRRWTDLTAYGWINSAKLKLRSSNRDVPSSITKTRIRSEMPAGSRIWWSRRMSVRLLSTALRSRSSMPTNRYARQNPLKCWSNRWPRPTASIISGNSAMTTKGSLASSLHTHCKIEPLSLLFVGKNVIPVLFHVDQKPSLMGW